MSRQPSDPSTAPTTPQIGSTSRTWRPTPNVPRTITRRHRQNPLTDDPSGSDQQHRWLSEDEGTGGGPSRLAGRRKRRDHRSSDPRATDDDPGYGSGGPSGGGSHRPTPPSRATTGRARSKVGQRLQNPIDAVIKSQRPIVRRAISMEHRPTTPPVSVPDVGAQPPRIADLVPPPTSPVAIARGMGTAPGSTYTTYVAEGPSAASEQVQSEMVSSNVPDFAPGRGGDGIGGTGRPSGGGRDRHAEARARVERQKQTLAKLTRILAWYVYHHLNGMCQESVADQFQCFLSDSARWRINHAAQTHHPTLRPYFIC